MKKHPGYYIIILAAFICLGVSPHDNPGYSTRHGINPTLYMTERAMEYDLLLIGTRHRDASIHALITSALPDLVHRAGINTLFIEIPSSQQSIIRAFNHNRAKISEIKMWDVIQSPSYHNILFTARDLGVSIVAVDKPRKIPGSRDAWMSEKISLYLKAHTGTKAVVIAGTRHVLKDLQWQATPEPSLADRLQYRHPFSIVMWPDFLMHGHAIGLDISGMSPKTCPYPPMQAMNLMPFSSLTASADGVILLPEQEI